MKIEVFRLEYYKDTTIGELFIDGSFFCYTLEDTVRPFGVKVKGHTAIPEGHYTLWLTLSSRFKRVLPDITNVPYFKGIRIHRGNSHEHSEGCILVGYKKDGNKIYESAKAEIDLISKLSTCVHDFYIKNVINT